MKILRNIGIGLLFTSVLFINGGCLKFQRNADYTPSVLDNHINMTAWQYIKTRSYNYAGKDTIFKLMRQAIEYSGIDTNEYIKDNRTFMLLHNDAILRTTVVNKVNTPTTDCYFGKYLVNGKPGTKWSDYPQIQVKNYLLSLIVQGAYSYNNLGPSNTTVNTLEPLNYDPLNTNSIMMIHITDDSNYSIRLNDFSGSVAYVTVRTSNILATNGYIHVIDRVLFYQSQ